MSYDEAGHGMTRPVRDEVKWLAGDRCHVHDGTHNGALVARVMAVAEGYAMLRYPHCIPFVVPLKSLARVGQLAP